MPTTHAGEASNEKVLCTICNDPIAGTDWIVCARCDVPIHRQCWHYAEKCPVYACGSTESREATDLLGRSKAPIVINDPAMPAPAAPSAVPASPEERAATYLKLDTRRGELQDQLNVLVRKKRGARMYIPGGFWIPPFIMMMILAPNFWHVWVALFAFGAAMGGLKKIRLMVEAPSDEEIVRVRHQLQTVERFCKQLEPPPDGQWRRLQ